MEFRAELYNSFNHTNLYLPASGLSGTLSTATALNSPTGGGAISGTFEPRIVQFGLKVLYYPLAHSPLPARALLARVGLSEIQKGRQTTRVSVQTRLFPRTWEEALSKLLIESGGQNEAD